MVTVSLDGGAVALFAVGVVAIVVLLALRPIPMTRTACFCPTCHEDLVSSGSYVGLNPTILGPTACPAESYRCASCGTVSSWDFDSFPVPVMLSFFTEEGELDGG